MVNESTVQKLNEMRMTAMADAFRIQEKDVAFASLSLRKRKGLAKGV